MIEGMQSDPVDLVITGGSVVNADWHGPSGVCVTEGRVSHLVQPGSPLPELSPGARVIDATGLLVMPGGVDPHTHVNLAIGAWTTLDDYAQASRAAIWGGTTTLVDFAIPVPGQTPLEAVRERRAAAVSAHCDTALHGCVVDWDDTVPAQIAAMADAGVRTIKMFTTYRDTVMAEPLTVLRVMQAIAEVGGMAVVHAESDHVLAETQERMAAAGRIDAGHHAETRSVLAEVSAVREVLDIAEHLGVPVYFVHQSDAEAVAAVRAARHRGVRAYSETCPHYLTLDSSVYERPDAELFVCCPPLRPAPAVRGLVDAALAHDIDTVGSDHCCYDVAQKAEHRHDVRVLPAGLPGVETRLPVTFTTLVEQGGMSWQRYVALVSTNPARLNGLYPRKGVIAPGADADLVLLDPAARRVVRAAELHMQTDYSPYEGRELTGWPVTVVVGGSVVVDQGELMDPDRRGQPIAASPLDPRTLVC